MDVRNPLLQTWRDTLPPMTYADVAAIARRLWLMPLARAAGVRTLDAALMPLYRPLGGALLLRLLRNPALELAKQDELALLTAREMLAAWIDASASDDSPVPAVQIRVDRDEAARAVLMAELGRHWV